MKVKDLKEYLANLDDNAELLLIAPVSEKLHPDKSNIRELKCRRYKLVTDLSVNKQSGKEFLFVEYTSDVKMYKITQYEPAPENS